MGPGPGVAAPRPGGGSDVTLYSKLFECKFKDEIPRYDGKKDGVNWRKRVRNFLTSRCPDMAEALNRAERPTGTIHHGSLQGVYAMGGAHVAVLDALLWGFLNTNLVDDAWNELRNHHPGWD